MYISNQRQTRHFEYRDGYYDGAEKQFRGFEHVTVTTDGDSTVEQGTTAHVFDVGRTDVYKKALLKKQVVQSAGRELHDISSSFSDCSVGGITGTPTPAVRFVCQTSSENLMEEGAASSAWVTTREEYEYDSYGNRTKTTKYGVTSIGGSGCPDSSHGTDAFGAPSGPDCLGDESIEQVTFVPPTATGGLWMLNKPATKRGYGQVNGTIYAETINHYDGDAFVGLPAGQLTKGLLTRSESRVDAKTLIDTQRSQFDAHGNPLEARDPNNHARRFTYDDAGLLLLTEEVVFDQQNPPYSLLMSAAYDSLHETISDASAWMRVEGGSIKSAPRNTQYSYDEFGRLTSIARPGDTAELPTETFSYDITNPVSRIIRRARSQSGSDLDVEEVQCFDGLGRKYETRARIEGTRYQVSGYNTFDIQGNSLDAYQPFLGSSGTCDRVAPQGVLAARTRHDASQRAIDVTQPDSDIYGSSSISSTEYRPLRTIARDAEDNDPASAHFQTPEVTTVDGLGRTTGVDRYLTRDQPVHLELTYDELGHLRGYVDAAGNQKVQTYDLLGRVLQVQDPDSGLTAFTYDAFIRLDRGQ